MMNKGYRMAAGLLLIIIVMLGSITPYVTVPYVRSWYRPCIHRRRLIEVSYDHGYMLVSEIEVPE